MTEANLKKTISILYDMELNNYYMTQAISQLAVNINSLGKSNRIAKPEKESAGSPFFYAVGGFIFGAISVIYGIIEFIKNFRLLYLITIIPTLIIYFAIGAAIGAAIGFVIDLFGMASEKRRANARYDSALVKYEKALADDKKRVEREKVNSNKLYHEYLVLKERKSEAERQLQNFYIQAGIDSRFRNIVAMGYMNEFINLGISRKLEGADGLYYLIMQELRWDQMQYTLEEISSKLDAVIDNQRLIHSDLKKMNRESKYMIDRVVRGVNNLNSNVNDLKAIEQYNGDRIARELEFQNFMLICNS